MVYSLLFNIYNFRFSFLCLVEDIGKNMSITHYKFGYCSPCNGQHIDRNLEIGDILMVGGEVKRANTKPFLNISKFYFDLMDKWMGSPGLFDTSDIKFNRVAPLEAKTMNNEQDKVVKVSDWSQKYKLAIYAVSGIGMVWVGIRIINLLEEIKLLLTK